jgi:hypothetical protein
MQIGIITLNHLERRFPVPEYFDMEGGYALYLSYTFWLHSTPLPVDAYFAIVAAGHDPVELDEVWEDGYVPEFDTIINSEFDEFDEDED